MKRLVQSSILVLILVFCFNLDVYGQLRDRGGDSDLDEYFDDSKGFKHRLWYGGGFNLGFTGNNISSQFNLGISPMVGYKVFDGFSVGPRISLSYSFFSYDDGFINDSAQPISYGVGAFARYKIVRSIFGHLEFEYEDIGLVGFSNNELEVVRRSQENVYIGVGYSSSGGSLFGFEVLLLYNLNVVDNPFFAETPWDLRFGVNYNF